MIQNNTPTKPAELYQVALTFFSLLIIIIISIVNVNSRITALEIKQIENEKFNQEIRDYFNKLNDGQTKILIELQNKQNR